MRPRFPLSHRARDRKEKDDGERTRTEKEGGLTTAIIDEQTRPSGKDQPGHRWKGSTLTQVERINPAVHRTAAPTRDPPSNPPPAPFSSQRHEALGSWSVVRTNRVPTRKPFLTTNHSSSPNQTLPHQSPRADHPMENCRKPGAVPVRMRRDEGGQSQRAEGVPAAIEEEEKVAPRGIGAAALAEEVVGHDLPSRFEHRPGGGNAAGKWRRGHAEDVACEQKGKANLPCRTGLERPSLDVRPVNLSLRQRCDLRQKLEAMPEVFGRVTARKHGKVRLAQRRKGVSVDDHGLAMLPGVSEIDPQRELDMRETPVEVNQYAAGTLPRIINEERLAPETAVRPALRLPHRLDLAIPEALQQRLAGLGGNRIDDDVDVAERARPGIAIELLRQDRSFEHEQRDARFVERARDTRQFRDHACRPRLHAEGLYTQCARYALHRARQQPRHPLGRSRREKRLDVALHAIPARGGDEDLASRHGRTLARRAREWVTSETCVPCAARRRGAAHWRLDVTRPLPSASQATAEAHKTIRGAETDAWLSVGLRLARCREAAQGG